MVPAILSWPFALTNWCAFPRPKILKACGGAGAACPCGHSPPKSLSYNVEQTFQGIWEGSKQSVFLAILRVGEGAFESARDVMSASDRSTLNPRSPGKQALRSFVVCQRNAACGGRSKRYFCLLPDGLEALARSYVA